MALSELPASDCRIIFECLTAAAKGPFFGDDELSMLFGVTRQELLGIVACIPHIDDEEPEVRRAIGNTLNNLLGYPHGEESRWREWISADPLVVKQVESRWRAIQPPIEYSSLEVHGPAKIEGQFYRVVAYTVRNGGHGMCSEVWRRGKWVWPAGGPGCNSIMTAMRATELELRQAGVDCSPLPPLYDPLATESEEPQQSECGRG